MLLFDRDGKKLDPAFDTMLDRLKALIADMERVRAGLMEKDLPDDAPMLDQWMIVQRPVACLAGRSSGHPILMGEGRPIATSDLWLISEDGQWARTLSRWYRLGRPVRHQIDQGWRQ